MSCRRVCRGSRATRLAKRRSASAVNLIMNAHGPSTNSPDQITNLGFAAIYAAARSCCFLQTLNVLLSTTPSLYRWTDRGGNQVSMLRLLHPVMIADRHPIVECRFSSRRMYCASSGEKHPKLTSFTASRAKPSPLRSSLRTPSTMSRPRSRTRRGTLAFHWIVVRY